MPATLPPAGDPSTVHVIDVGGYVFRAYYAVPPLSNSRGEPTNATLGVTTMILKLVREQRPAMLAVAMDSRARSFRHEMYPEYKATRREAPPDLGPQIERMREIIEAYAIPCLGVEGMEADDIIATVVRRAREKGLRVVIVSADKDLLQLVDEGVVMYDAMRDKVFGREETVEKMGVPPEKVRDLLALTGDSSDNIPGVPHVGPKTAAQLLAEFPDLDAIYSGLDTIKRRPIRETLAAHRDDAFLSRKLVSLRDDVPIDFDTEALQYGGADENRLRSLFMDLEFTRLLAQLKPPEPDKPADYSTVLDAEALRELATRIRASGRLSIFPALDGPDPLTADLVGLALAWEPRIAAYVPLTHRYLGVPSQLPRDVALDVLKPLLEDAALPKTSSDVKRDENLFARYGIALRGVDLDTMLASYLLDPERHSHSLVDVARTELHMTLITFDAVTDKQRGSQKSLTEIEVERARDFAGQQADAALLSDAEMRPRIEMEGFLGLMRDIELPLAHVLSDLERIGVRVDVPHLKKLGAALDAELGTLDKRCREIVGRDFNVSSPRQLESILFDELKLRVVKRTRTGRSTDADVLEELAQEHPLPAAIMQHRVLSKLKGTYIDALPRQVHPATGRVHTRFNQAVAATGRLSSSEPNLQNIPIRTELGREIRRAFVPRDGWLILSADYSQIELRLLAHLSHDPELVEAFVTGEDVHVRTARALFNVPTEGVTREMRGRSKTVNFAVIYGQTQFALARNLGIERAEAQRYIDAFFARYAGVRRFLEGVVEQARKANSVRTILGRRRILHDMHSRNRALRLAAERVACNTPIQGGAADIMKLAMVRIHRAMVERRVESKMLLTVHDELVFEVPPPEKDAMAELVRESMENVIALDVPLTVDQGWGANWDEAH